MQKLKGEFLNAFKEGLVVFFSPFTGFWQAVRALPGLAAHSRSTVIPVPEPREANETSRRISSWVRSPAVFANWVSISKEEAAALNLLNPGLRQLVNPQLRPDDEWAGEKAIEINTSKGIEGRVTAQFTLH